MGHSGSQRCGGTRGGKAEEGEREKGSGAAVGGTG